MRVLLALVLAVSAFGQMPKGGGAVAPGGGGAGGGAPIAGPNGTITINTGVNPNEIEVTDSVFGKLGTTNTWSDTQSFSVPPVFTRGFNLPSSILWLREDFLEPFGAGNTKWAFSKVPSASGTAAVGGGTGAIASHPGIATISTGTTVSTGGVVYVGQSFSYTAVHKDDLLTKPFIADFVFSISDTSNTETVIGFLSMATSVAPGNRIVMRADTASASTFQFQTCNNSGPTCVTTGSGVTVDTSWHRLRIYRQTGDTAGTVRFCMDACAAPVQITSNITTATGYNPAALIGNNASRSTAAVLTLDYAEFTLEVGARW